MLLEVEFSLMCVVVVDLEELIGRLHHHLHGAVMLCAAVDLFGELASTKKEPC